MPYYTHITSGAAANAATINAPLTELETAITNLHTQTDGTLNSDGTRKSNIIGATQVVDGALTLAKLAIADKLKLMGRRGFHVTAAVTFNAIWTSLMASATGVWDDGSTGTYTSTINSTWGAIDGWAITHDSSGKTLTQPVITRDSQGRETVRPALTVTP